MEQKRGVLTGGLYRAVLEMVPLHLVATPIYMQGRLEMRFIYVSREEGMDSVNRETLFATKTHIFI